MAGKLGVPVEKCDVVALDRVDNELAYRILMEGKTAAVKLAQYLAG